jgi:hypothetical protein
MDVHDHDKETSLVRAVKVLVVVVSGRSITISELLD